MSARLRAAAMPAAALALVGGVLTVQIANGGGSFEPLHPAPPCAARPQAPRPDGLDELAERLVVAGIDGAACRLHVTREALTLELAQTDSPTDAQIDALHNGLLAAVRRMKADGSLPPASSLVDDALDEADLGGLLEAGIRAVPTQSSTTSSGPTTSSPARSTTSTCASSSPTSTTRTTSSVRSSPPSAGPSSTR